MGVLIDMVDMFRRREPGYAGEVPHAAIDCPVCGKPWRGHDNDACLPPAPSPSDEATALFTCPYCSAPAGTPCGVVPHQLRLDLLDVDAESLLGPHWLVSSGSTGEPMAEQCVCHLPYDHDELGAVAR